MAMTDITEMKFDVIKVVSNARSRRIKASWNIEFDERNYIEAVPGSDGRAVRYYFGWHLQDRAKIMTAFIEWCRERSLRFHIEGDLELYEYVEVSDLDDEDFTELMMRWQ